jgi:hypothetical protein
MTIFALKGPSSEDYNNQELEEARQFLTDSIKNGASRFGWSYIDTADLEQLKNKHQKQAMAGHDQRRAKLLS